MCDVFEDHPTVADEREKLWPLIRVTPWLDWQILTKRPERILANLPSDWLNGYPNVWLGTSIENNEYVHRADDLRHIPATVRFVSYEPALGPLDRLNLTGLDWVIYGGESGPEHRPHDLTWPRQMKAMCESAGVAFFYKQSAALRTELGTTLDDQVVREYPRRRIPLA
jgi:protein gp37